MNYKETLDYLFTRLPMFQRSGPAAYKSSLDNTLKLDEYYGHPHPNFKTIHVAGTNGKGSVSHMLAAILQTAGYKTGLYTSPHLKDFRERIRVNGQVISENKVVEWVDTYRINNEVWKLEPSFFELTVALAFDHFEQEKVDIAVVEVGLGGRLDSTNIITPEVSVITNIGLDHTDLLGKTLEVIAAEKAGIIKNGVPVVIGTTQPETSKVFGDFAKRNKTQLFYADTEFSAEYAMTGLDGLQRVNVERERIVVYPELKLDLLGAYQLKNLPAVLKTIELLRNKEYQIANENIYEGLQAVTKLTGLLGRWQIIGNNPLIVCDTGHNEDGIRMLVRQIENMAFKTLHFVLGLVGDKDPENILRLLPQKAIYYFTKADIPRAMDEKDLAQKANKYGLEGNVYSSVIEALEAARQKSKKQDLVFVGGSTFVVAEIL